MTGLSFSTKKIGASMIGFPCKGSLLRLQKGVTSSMGVGI